MADLRDSRDIYNEYGELVATVLDAGPTRRVEFNTSRGRTSCIQSRTGSFELVWLVRFVETQKADSFIMDGSYAAHELPEIVERIIHDFAGDIPSGINFGPP